MKRCTTSITSRSTASIAGAMQAQQQRHIGKGDAGDADGDDAPRPDLDIGRGLGANAEQAERPGQRPHDTDQPARQRIGVDDREDHQPGGGEIADLGAQQHRGDADEDQHRQQFEHQTPQHERQPDQRLPGARQTETPLMPFRLRGDIGGGGRRIGHRQRLRRRRARFAATRASSNATGRLMTAEHQPFGGEGAAEHQRQFPGDIEQLVIGGGIVGGSHDPVIERRKMRQRPRHVGDLARDLADLLGHRQQELGAEAVRRRADRGLRSRRGAACACGEALAIARSVSIICARLVSSCSVSSARLA